MGFGFTNLHESQSCNIVVFSPSTPVSWSACSSCLLNMHAVVVLELRHGSCDKSLQHDQVFQWFQTPSSHASLFSDFSIEVHSQIVDGRAIFSKKFNQLWSINSYAHGFRIKFCFLFHHLSLASVGVGCLHQDHNWGYLLSLCTYGIEVVVFFLIYHCFANAEKYAFE